MHLNEEVPRGPHCRGSSTASPGKSAQLGASLNCLYANADRMGNKREEFKVCVQLQGYDLTGITEAWWDSSRDWGAAMDGERLFRKDRMGDEERESSFLITMGRYGALPRDG